MSLDKCCQHKALLSSQHNSHASCTLSLHFAQHRTAILYWLDKVCNSNILMSLFGAADVFPGLLCCDPKMLPVLHRTHCT
uniref:TonB-dependent hemin, ferrichrome receptor n=1 Tax=Klebsiella pneumoniae TaxID=573 RepID=A0A8B0SXY1_KLEPN|nr:TonB-dependent hemin, ferrichrome receptor [Klebsiella pneumoniae]